MARVNIKGIPEIEKNILKTFGKVQESNQMRQEIGEFVVGRIQLEARRAKPLNDTRTFPPLKKSSEQIRRELAEINATHPAFVFNKSNLTFSGQLIDAIKFSLTKTDIVIEVENSKRRLVREFEDTFDIELQELNKAASKKTKTNKEVDRDLRKRGFFLYTAKGIDSEPKVSKRINNIVKKFIRRAIKVNFGS